MKAEPSVDDKDKDFDLTCKWNVYNMTKSTGLGGQQNLARNLATNTKSTRS